jgi:hypothetical protein
MGFESKAKVIASASRGGSGKGTSGSRGQRGPAFRLKSNRSKDSRMGSSWSAIPLAPISWARAPAETRSPIAVTARDTPMRARSRRKADPALSADLLKPSSLIRASVPFSRNHRQAVRFHGRCFAAEDGASPQPSDRSSTQAERCDRPGLEAVRAVVGAAAGPKQGNVPAAERAVGRCLSRIKVGRAAFLPQQEHLMLRERPCPSISNVSFSLATA